MQHFLLPSHSFIRRVIYCVNKCKAFVIQLNNLHDFHKWRIVNFIIHLVSSFKISTEVLFSCQNIHWVRYDNSQNYKWQCFIPIKHKHHKYTNNSRKITGTMSYIYGPPLVFSSGEVSKGNCITNVI